MADKEFAQYGGHKVFITERGCFTVKIGDHQIEKETYSALQEAVDRYEKSLERVQRKKLNVAVSEEGGRPYTLTGVHQGNGNLLLTPKRDRWGRSELYLKTEASDQLLSQVVLAKKTLHALLEKLKLYRLPSSFELVKSYVDHAAYFEALCAWIEKRLAEEKEA